MDNDTNTTANKLRDLVRQIGALRDNVRTLNILLATSIDFSSDEVTSFCDASGSYRYIRNLDEQVLRQVFNVPPDINLGLIENLWIKVGSSDTRYHEFSHICYAVNHLFRQGLMSPLNRRGPTSFTSIEFYGDNNIKMFWGERNQTPTRELSDQELASVNLVLADVLENAEHAWEHPQLVGVRWGNDVGVVDLDRGMVVLYTCGELEGGSFEVPYVDISNEDFKLLTPNGEDFLDLAMWDNMPELLSHDDFPLFERLEENREDDGEDFDDFDELYVF